jgi:hypothetical protein
LLVPTILLMFVILAQPAKFQGLLGKKCIAPI